MTYKMRLNFDDYWLGSNWVELDEYETGNVDAIYEQLEAELIER